MAINLANLKNFPRSDGTTEPLADKPTQVRLPRFVAVQINRLGEDKTPWLRRVITEAAQRELMNAPQGDTQDATVTDYGRLQESPSSTRQTGKSKTKAQPTVEESPTSETTPKRRGRPRKKPVEG